MEVKCAIDKSERVPKERAVCVRPATVQTSDSAGGDETKESGDAVNERAKEKAGGVGRLGWVHDAAPFVLLHVQSDHHLPPAARAKPTLILITVDASTALPAVPRTRTAINCGRGTPGRYNRQSDGNTYLPTYLLGLLRYSTCIQCCNHRGHLLIYEPACLLPRTVAPAAFAPPPDNLKAASELHLHIPTSNCCYGRSRRAVSTSQEWRPASSLARESGAKETRRHALVSHPSFTPRI